MKIIDTFTFFNELELLEFRLRLLDGYVDHFVIAESNLTHAGDPKPLYFRDNKERFSKWKNKITHIVVEQSAAGLEFRQNDNYDPGAASWKLENEQRNALHRAQELGGDDDIFLVGDLDELPDPRVLKKLNSIIEPVAFSMLFHYYFMNCQNIGKERWWNGTIACRGRDWKASSPQFFRDQRNELSRTRKAGWHFSYLGGLEKIRQKIRSFAHTEFNREEFINEENILLSMKQGRDLFGREGVSYKFFPLEYYPAMLRNLMKEYPAFVYPAPASPAQKLIYSLKHLAR